MAQHDFPLHEATIDQLRQHMEAGKYSSHELTRLYLERIEALDRQGPKLRSMIEVNPDALAQAKMLDDERKAGNVRGSLHGIPIVLKDNIATADGMNTTAGSLALIGSRPRRDAFVAERLREAGAVFLGKANMTEWANIRSPRASSGWSARGGQCRNPYALDRSPSGSSSGTGASVAANLAAAGIGTETDGSIVSPSSACSLVGIKPTMGLLSRSGILPIAVSLDTAGPMTRTVRDAAILLGGCVGVDPRDPVTEKSRDRFHTDYTPFLDPGGLKGKRLGVLRRQCGHQPRALRFIQERFDLLQQFGAELVDLVEVRVEDTGEWEIMMHELKAGLNAYLEDLGESPVRALEDVIAFNERNADREMVFFDQENFQLAQTKEDLNSSLYLEAVAKQKRVTAEIEAALESQRLDAFVSLTGGIPGLIDPIMGDCRGGNGTGTSGLAAISGLPHITVPAGYLFGLPLGISFIGRAFSEPELLRLAYGFEHNTSYRQAPTFVPSIRFD